MKSTKEAYEEGIGADRHVRNKENYIDFLVEISGKDRDYFSGLIENDLYVIDDVVSSLKVTSVSKCSPVGIFNRRFGLAEFHKKEVYANIATKEGIAPSVVRMMVVKALGHLRFTYNKILLRLSIDTSDVCDSI